MIVTFPNFGTARLVLPKILNAAGVIYVVPPGNNNDMLKKGAALSPEEMCIPFKYMIGNLIEAYEMGADTVVMAATAGPCRLGEYGQLMMEILKKHGYDYEWIVLDTPSVIGVAEFMRRIGRIFYQNGMTTFSETMRRGALLSAAAVRGLRLVKSADDFKADCMRLSGHLKNTHIAAELIREAEEKTERASDFKECGRVLCEYRKKLKAAERNENAKPLRILVAGEIYTTMDRETNRNLEEKLMELGCSVSSHINMSWWIKHTIVSAAALQLLKNFRKKGMTCDVGGYARETANRITRAKQYDGIIKIMPSGCMPEIVTKAYCESSDRNGNIKILHLIYDEISGNAGYETRIEAFTDMLERRKNVLARN